MVVRALLVLVLAFGVLFAWRAWRPMPGLAIFAAMAAAGVGALLLGKPLLAGLGLLIAAALIAYVSRKPR